MPGSCLFRDKQEKRKYISLCRQDFMAVAFCRSWKLTNKQITLIYLIWDGSFFNIMRQTCLHRITESCRTVALHNNLDLHGLGSLVWPTAQSRLSCMVRPSCSGLYPSGWKPQFCLPGPYSAGRLFLGRNAFPVPEVISMLNILKTGIAWSAATLCYVVLYFILQLCRVMHDFLRIYSEAELGFILCL